MLHCAIIYLTKMIFTSIEGKWQAGADNHMHFINQLSEWPPLEKQ